MKQYSKGDLVFFFIIRAEAVFIVFNMNIEPWEQIVALEHILLQMIP